MTMNERCLAALGEEHMFLDSGHRTRFKELLDCFSSQPFFTPGLCKCMYLSAWDEGHFCIMLETLNQMALGGETGLEGMRFTGDLLANAFLDDAPFSLDPAAQIPDEIRYIIDQALKAAAIIDQCFETAG